MQEKIARLGEFQGFAGPLFGDVETDRELLDGAGAVLAEAERALTELEPFSADAIERALKDVCERRSSSSRARRYISRGSAGLYESIELLGKDETLARIRRAASVAA